MFWNAGSQASAAGDEHATLATYGTVAVADGCGIGSAPGNASRRHRLGPAHGHVITVYHNGHFVCYDLADVNAKDVRRLLRDKGCVEVRQTGSHRRVQCGICATTVPLHRGEELGPGLLRAIERDLEPCLGKGWLRKR